MRNETRNSRAFTGGNGGGNIWQSYSLRNRSGPNEGRVVRILVHQDTPTHQSARSGIFWFYFE